jgi:hypothetical protein
MNKQQKTNAMMLSLAVAFGVILTAGLIAIPAIEEAHACDLDKAICDKVHERVDALKAKIRDRLPGGGGGDVPDH